MLSELLRYVIPDHQGRRGGLSDLVIDLATKDYPPVTRLLVVGPDGQAIDLPWESVQETNWRNRQLVVADLAAGQPSADTLDHAVLLKRDVLDTLVLDLENRNATRANDLWLWADDGQLRLRGADVSPWAVLRRLGRGMLGRGADRNLLDWRHVEFLRGDPRAARAGGDYHRRVANLAPAEIARLVDAVPYVHAAELLTLLPDPLAADSLEAMGPERQLQILEELDEDQTVCLLTLMAPDIAADVLGRLETQLAQRYLQRLPSPARERVLELLEYPEDSAGGIMTNEIVTTLLDLSVGQAREALADQLQKPDFVYYVYVIDDERACNLRGVLTLRDLLLEDVNRPLSDVMKPNPVTVGPHEPATRAAHCVAEYNLAALPIVDGEGKLLGAVTFDAAMAQIAPPSWRDLAPRVFS